MFNTKLSIEGLDWDSFHLSPLYWHDKKVRGAVQKILKSRGFSIVSSKDETHYQTRLRDEVWCDKYDRAVVFLCIGKGTSDIKCYDNWNREKHCGSFRYFVLNTDKLELFLNTFKNTLKSKKGD